MRYVAIDWSGAKNGGANTIWWAEVVDGYLVRLESGRTREQVVDRLIAEAENDPEFIVGLDFAFSFPAWFIKTRQLGAGVPLWDAVGSLGEGWLQECASPFWGRKGSSAPPNSQRFRKTERALQTNGSQPKSVFQIAGAGAVGTGSIRGMPFLARLSRAGFAIWPFDPMRPPAVIEIYPRLFIGDVINTNLLARKAYLDREFPEMRSDFACLAASSADAFDAAVSAMAMARHGKALDNLPVARDATEALEGRIWWPEGEPDTREIAAADPSCPFCTASNPLIASDHALALPDAYPLTEGHTLVIPRRHVSSVFDLEDAALRDLWQLVGRVRDHLLERYAPDAFTIGVNDGEAAGQTVSHAHVHVIPRRTGDVPDPRGGVRWVVPERARYWEP